MALYNIIDKYLDAEYCNYLLNIVNLVNGKLNIHIVSRNDNNNIYIIKKIVNKLWGLSIENFKNIKIDNGCKQYYKDNIKYNNKKDNECIYMYENNININNINIKILFTDFKKFKFTEQKYYIQYLEYIVNLNTINKVHYIVIINNFDYVINDYYKLILYMIEKYKIQFIIFTSNNNIKYTFKSFFVTIPFVFIKTNDIYMLAYDNFMYDNELKNIENIKSDYMSFFKINYSTICSIVNYDMYKIIIICKLYIYYLINDKIIHNKHNIITESIIYVSNNNINFLVINDKLDNAYKLSYFINNYINKYFIINKYLIFLEEHILLYHITKYYIDTIKLTKKKLHTLYTKFNLINNNIRYLTYILSCNIDCIEYLLIKLQSILNYKNSIINIVYDYLLLLHNNNIIVINNYKIVINTLILYSMYNEPVLCNIHNTVNIILNNDINQFLNTFKYLKSIFNNFRLSTNIDTKTKYINNKYNKMLFILNNNNII